RRSEDRGGGGGGERPEVAHPRALRRARGLPHLSGRRRARPAAGRSRAPAPPPAQVVAAVFGRATLLTRWPRGRRGRYTVRLDRRRPCIPSCCTPRAAAACATARKTHWLSPGGAWSSRCTKWTSSRTRPS